MNSLNRKISIYIYLKCKNILFSNLLYGEMYNTTNAKNYSDIKCNTKK